MSGSPRINARTNPYFQSSHFSANQTIPPQNQMYQSPQMMAQRPQSPRSRRQSPRMRMGSPPPPMMQPPIGPLQRDHAYFQNPRMMNAQQNSMYRSPDQQRGQINLTRDDLPENKKNTFDLFVICLMIFVPLCLLLFLLYLFAPDFGAS